MLAHSLPQMLLREKEGTVLLAESIWHASCCQWLKARQPTIFPKPNFALLFLPIKGQAF